MFISLQNFRFLSKISIFYKNFDFCQRFRFFDQTFRFIVFRMKLIKIARSLQKLRKFQRDQKCQQNVAIFAH